MQEQCCIRWTSQRSINAGKGPHIDICNKNGESACVVRIVMVDSIHQRKKFWPLTRSIFFLAIALVKSNESRCSHKYIDSYSCNTHFINMRQSANESWRTLVDINVNESECQRTWVDMCTQIIQCTNGNIWCQTAKRNKKWLKLNAFRIALECWRVCSTSITKTMFTS